MTVRREQVKSISIQQDACFLTLDKNAQQIIKTLLENNKTLQGSLRTQFTTFSLIEQEEHAKTRNILIDRAEETCKRKVELALLESLRFDTTSRYEAVMEAYQRTFEWIFQDPDMEGKPWNNFCEWLQSGNGIYW